MIQVVISPCGELYTTQAFATESEAKAFMMQSARAAEAFGASIECRKGETSPLVVDLDWDADKWRSLWLDPERKW